MRLRHPNPGDRSVLLRLARMMHEESYYRDFTFVESRFDDVLEQCFHNSDWLALVLEHGDEVIGFFCAVQTEYFFSNDRYACDLCLYILPKHRGGMGAPRMVKAFEAWCRIKGVKEMHLGVSTEVNAARTAEFYQAMGYHSPAMGFRKKVRF